MIESLAKDLEAMVEGLAKMLTRGLTRLATKNKATPTKKIKWKRPNFGPPQKSILRNHEINCSSILLTFKLRRIYQSIRSQLLFKKLYTKSYEYLGASPTLRVFFAVRKSLRYFLPHKTP